MKLRLSRITLLILTLAVTEACTNVTDHSTLSTTNTTIIGSSSENYSHTLVNAVPTALSDGSDGIEIALSTDTSSTSYQPLTQFCGVGSSTIPCVCELVWTVTGTDGTSSYQRTKRSPLTAVQSGLAKCTIEGSVWGEIDDATVIQMNIVAVSPNVSGLNVKPVSYKKGSSLSSNGDFLDDTLTPFRNIYRYTCYSRRNNTYEILNQYQPTTLSSGVNVNVLLASRFCTGDSSGSAQCATPRNGVSAQSYYRNLFVRSDKLGEINSQNSFYECPKVQESILYSAGQDVPQSEEQKYWPLDSSFALATSYSSDWSVPIRAGALLYKNGDANAVSEACDPRVDTDTTPSKYLNETGVITYKCLGYAKKPNTNGTCGTITDNNGRVRPLVRLRRYRAIFPPTYEYNGSPSQQAAYADEVYVADRLVVDSNGVPTGNEIYGPKPCNYSWFDHEGVTMTNDGVHTGRYGETGMDFQTNFSSPYGPSSFPSYVATLNYAYDNGTISYSVNPDGRVLPNFDRGGTVGAVIGPSCSATISLTDYLLGVPSTVHLMTSNVDNPLWIDLSSSRKIYLDEIHVNPVDPWTPNYVEDTTFQACVPSSDPYIEPPLHFYKKDTNTMAWCAEVYPTQNPYWTTLNAKKRATSTTLTSMLVNYPTAAKVQGFTSHAIGGVTATALDGYNTANSACSVVNNDEVCKTSLGVSSGASYNDCRTYLDGLSVWGATQRGLGISTCDRTVSFDPNEEDRIFPLLAKDADIDNMLKNDLDHDKSYGCEYSVNTDPAKIGTKIPSTGCCGVVNGTAILQTLDPSDPTKISGHLEPFLNSASPSNRFCGNPVE